MSHTSKLSNVQVLLIIIDQNGERNCTVYELYENEIDMDDDMESDSLSTSAVASGDMTDQ
jgi:hypothetical protein